MSELIGWEESTMFTQEQYQQMLRKTKIHKLANLMRQIKYPVFPNSTNWADFGIQFGSHVYEFVAEYLIDHGVEVDVVHCSECQHLDKKVDCGGFCKCGEVVGSYPKMRVNWGYCDYGERRESCEKK